jgi:hypothetical protein
MIISSSILARMALAERCWSIAYVGKGLNIPMVSM